MCIKSNFEEITVKLSTYGQREKASLLSSKFCPQGVVCPCPGAINMYKNLGWTSAFLEILKLSGAQISELYFRLKTHAVFNINISFFFSSLYTGPILHCLVLF